MSEKDVEEVSVSAPVKKIVGGYRYKVVEAAMLCWWDVDVGGNVED